MKISVSLPEEDLAFVDDYAARSGHSSRSSVMRRALNVLRMVELEAAYADAWQEWDKGGQTECWDVTIVDGIDYAPR